MLPFISIVASGVFLLIFRRWVTTRRDESTPCASLTVGVVGAGAVGVVAGLKLLHGDVKTHAQGDSHGIIKRLYLIGRSSLKKQVEANNGKLSLVEPLRGQIQESEFQSDKAGRLRVIENNNEGDLDCLKECNVILVASKTTNTHMIATSLAMALPQDSNTTILSLQNGLENVKVLKAAMSNHPHVLVLNVVVSFPAEWQPHSARFLVARRGGKLFVEQPSVSSQTIHKIHARRVQQLSQLWTRAHLKTKLLSFTFLSLVQHVKFLINLVNPINALGGTSIPKLLADRGYRRICAEALREATPLLVRRWDSDGGKTFFGRMILQFVGRWILPTAMTFLPQALFALLEHKKGARKNNHDTVELVYKSSMLQDLERQRVQTEVDDLSGVIVRLGELYGTPTPIHKSLCRLVRNAEQNQNGSPMLSSAELCRQLGIK